MIKTILIRLLYALRPLLGPEASCKYYIGCTEYAAIQLEDLPFHKALYNIIKRILSCSPLW